MTEHIISNQQASTLPFIAGIILLVVLITLMSLSMSSISEERTDQQAVADISSLAGANVLARATQHIKIIDYVTWLRNMSQEILYLAATTATIRTGGEARELFTIPQKYEMATQPMIGLQLGSPRHLGHLDGLSEAMSWCCASSMGKHPRGSTSSTRRL